MPRKRPQKSRLRPQHPLINDDSSQLCSDPKERVEMKKIGVLAMVSLVSMASFAADVEPSLEQVDKLELQGERESSIRVLKEAEAASPENAEIDKRFPRPYPPRIHD